MMEYKGYLGAVAFDDADCVFQGRVLGIRDTVTFQGTSVDDLRRAFRDSVDDYLEFCTTRGEQPDRPFSDVQIVLLNQVQKLSYLVRLRSPRSERCPRCAETS